MPDLRRILQSIPLFRIFYSTTFTVLFILLLSLLLLTPADAVYQAYKANQLFNVFIIAGVYVLTLLLSILIYASRLYTNRSVLAAIPKGWVPVEDGDVDKSVRRLIVEGLARSAIVALEARPRYVDEEEEEAASHHHHQHHRLHHILSKHHGGSPSPPSSSVVNRQTWAHISHPGWSSPSSPDLPNLHYDSVIRELPNLIEAKAVSLAPPDPYQTPEPNLDITPPIPTPDPRVVEILQRPMTMGLRDYLAYLSSLYLIDPPTLASDFLTLYERARFSQHPLIETDFRKMMQIFAEILRGMSELDPDIVAELQRSDSEQDGELGTEDNDGESYTSFSSEDEGEASTPGRDDEQQNPTKPSARSRQSSLHSDENSSMHSIHTAPLNILRKSTTTSSRAPSSKAHSKSRSRLGRSAAPRTTSSHSFLHRDTAANGDRSRLPSFLSFGRRHPSSRSRSRRDTSSNLARQVSTHSAHPRTPSLQRLPSNYSMNSLRQMPSNVSRASERSVIRLAGRADEGLDLPYIIEPGRR